LEKKREINFRGDYRLWTQGKGAVIKRTETCGIPILGGEGGKGEEKVE